MIHYQQQQCPHCQGVGVVRHCSRAEMTCPLCAGTGKVNDFDCPIEDVEAQRSPPAKTSAELLARMIPRGSKPISALPPRRRRAHTVGNSTARLLGERYEPVAGAYYEFEKEA